MCASSENDGVVLNSRRECNATSIIDENYYRKLEDFIVQIERISVNEDYILDAN